MDRVFHIIAKVSEGSGVRFSINLSFDGGGGLILSQELFSLPKLDIFSGV